MNKLHLSYNASVHMERADTGTGAERNESQYSHLSPSFRMDV